MILQHGAVEKSAGRQWVMIELTSAKRVEATVRRLAKAMISAFKSDACEVFIPIARRDVEIFELSTGNILFIRGDIKKLFRLKTVTGVIGCLCSGELGRMSDVIWLEDSYVQELIAAEKLAFESKTFKAGDFVRVIDGQMKDMCGTVIAIACKSRRDRNHATIKKDLFENPDAKSARPQSRACGKTRLVFSRSR